MTSGTFSPSLGAPVAMGYVESDLTDPGTELVVLMRAKERPVRVVELPFVEHRYVRTTVGGN